MLRFLLTAGVLLLPFASSGAGEPHLTHGPFVGHVDTTSAMVWARVSDEGRYTLRVTEADSDKQTSCTARAARKNDNCIVWTVRGLEPNRTYRYEIARGNVVLAGGEEFTFRTAPPHDEPAKVRIALGSCADDREYKSQPAWSRMAAAGAEAIVALGDTPYIDSTDLDVQRRRYREFYAVPEIAPVLRHTPFYGTWDDHDFGADDSDGRLEGKHFSRRAFIDYHANPSYGDGRGGVHTSFRRGPVEVFLLDTRWFAGTEPSPVSDEGTTLLGAAQWKWLKRGLAKSTAPFKVIACGMIWNGATRPGKRDHWMTYPHEREALFRYIGENNVSGVVLVGGDIHRSRALRHPTRDSAGYELTELIASPIAQGVMEAANAPSPYLLHDAGHEHTFLLLTADSTVEPATLGAQVLAADGRELFAVHLDAATLSPHD